MRGRKTRTRNSEFLQRWSILCLHYIFIYLYYIRTSYSTEIPSSMQIWWIISKNPFERMTKINKLSNKAAWEWKQDLVLMRPGTIFPSPKDLLENSFVAIPDQEWLHQVPVIPFSHQSPIFKLWNRAKNRWNQITTPPKKIFFKSIIEPLSQTHELIEITVIKQ